MEWLKGAIVDYIRNNPNRHLDGVDIASHFKLRVDIVLNVIYELEEDNIVTLVYNGLNTRYLINKE